MITGGRIGGKGGGRPGHNGQGVSEHIAHLVVRASVAGPVRVFSACPEKQHGRWLDIGRANDRNRLLLRKGPVLCLMLPAASPDAIPVSDLGVCLSGDRLAAGSRHRALLRLRSFRCDAEEV